MSFNLFVVKYFVTHLPAIQSYDSSGKNMESLLWTQSISAKFSQITWPFFSKIFKTLLLFKQLSFIKPASALRTYFVTAWGNILSKETVKQKGTLTFVLFLDQSLLGDLWMVAYNGSQRAQHLHNNGIYLDSLKVPLYDKNCQSKTYLHHDDFFSRYSQKTFTNSSMIVRCLLWVHNLINFLHSSLLC